MTAKAATVTGWPKLGTHLEEVCAMKKILVTLATLAVSAGIALAGAGSARPTMTPACAGTAGSGAPACQDQVGLTGTRGTTGILDMGLGMFVTAGSIGSS